jgi:hypothetical protein
LGRDRDSMWGKRNDKSKRRTDPSGRWRWMECRRSSVGRELIGIWKDMGK